MQNMKTSWSLLVLDKFKFFREKKAPRVRGRLHQIMVSDNISTLRFYTLGRFRSMHEHGDVNVECA